MFSGNIIITLPVISDYYFSLIFLGCVEYGIILIRQSAQADRKEVSQVRPEITFFLMF